MLNNYSTGIIYANGEHNPNVQFSRKDCNGLRLMLYRKIIFKSIITEIIQNDRNTVRLHILLKNGKDINITMIRKETKFNGTGKGFDYLINYELLNSQKEALEKLEKLISSNRE